MDNISKAQSVGGCAVLGAMIAGVGALILALNSSKSGHFEAAAIALVAAAVAFAGVANTVFRH